ncbi:hypothetical protein [Mycobacterium sp. C31M]
MTEPASAAGRPEDVDTGIWLWAGALPLMVIGYLVDLFTAPIAVAGYVYAASILFVVVIAALVGTFTWLLRYGYRWPRTLLTAGGLTAVVYTVTSLFTVDRAEAVPAFGYAVCTIAGSVLIIGGVVLLHRKDAHEYLTR